MDRTWLDRSSIGLGLDAPDLLCECKQNRKSVYPDALLYPPQLDADDAEPKFDERECQDEYSEMHMPV